MNPETSQRAKLIFLEASTLPETEREALVAARAGGDVQLAAEVRSLLRYVAQPTTPPVDAGAIQDVIAGPCPEPDALVGRVIKGRYRIVRVVGRSAISSVYEAQQAQPRRAVAVKVLRFADPTSQLVSRVQHEAQLLAELRHPGITQVYEFGFFHDGSLRRPFIAMEFVRDGRSLTGFAADRGLGTRDRLTLFALVCEAVHHAHQKPIIHRDLKPGNILVDGSGAPKVIDFGVARATNAELALSTMHTSPGQLIGTLQYMSPEQCAADPRRIDVRSDIYSLGVVLFELLCGRPPYDLRDLPIATAAQIVQRLVPPRLSRIRPELRGDLETIVGKAMEKDPDARYQSASDLLEDIRRFLARRPIRSRPPGPWTRVRGWVADHPLRTSAATGVLILALSMVLTVGSVYLLALRPARLVLDPSSRTAVATSRAGHSLHEWELARPVHPTALQPRLVERPAWAGGGRIAIIACPKQAPDDVAAFDVARPDRPLWTTEVNRVEFPKGETGHPEASLVPTLLRVDDYIPESPGDEVLVVHELSGFSAAVIRIFDLSGKVRFEAWHDGWIGDAVCLASERLLVVGGVNSEHVWSSRRPPAPNSGTYPSALFAVKIEDGHLSRQWVVKDGRRLDSTLQWYKWLGPPEALRGLQTIRAIPRKWVGREGPESRITVSFAHHNSLTEEVIPGLLTISVDARGDEISRYTDEPYRLKAQRGEVPEDSALRLLNYEELPPFEPRGSAPTPPAQR